MAREFARQFYNSMAWRNVRAFVFKRDFGLCVRCGRVGCIVHHKKYLTPVNIEDPYISLNPDNLELLCRTCHKLEHEPEGATDKELTFDEEGNLIERTSSNDEHI